MKNTIYKMLMENTGVAIMDSGGESGRNWQQNQGKTLKDLENEQEVSIEIGDDEYDYTISLFHFLSSQLELDSLCEKFNAKKVNDWDSDMYGVSKSGKKWIEKQGFRILNTRNSYNGDSHLSQVIQWTELSSDDTNIADYILLQIHGGADVRGGYTDAKLFKVKNEYFGNEDVHGDMNTVQINNRYDGVKLTFDEGENENKEIEPKKGDNINLSL